MMKKIFRIFILLTLLNTDLSSAHVFPFPDERFTKEIEEYNKKAAIEGKPLKDKLSQEEYYYIRIIPSHVLEGFVSYDLCPLIQKSNVKKYLIKSEQNNLDITNYYHDLKNPDCERPYQINPLSEPVYFDVRDLNRILTMDDGAEKVRMLAEFVIIGAFAYLSGGVILPLFGRIASAGAETTLAISRIRMITGALQFPVGITGGMLASDPTKNFLAQVLPIDQIKLDETQIRYFMGVQAGNDIDSDIQWSILPPAVPTYGECMKTCSDRQAEKWNKSRFNLLDTQYAPSETTNNMNSFYRKNKCDLECNEYPKTRNSMKKIWKEMYLDTIYKAGHHAFNGEYPNYIQDDPHHRNADFKSLDSEKLYEHYHLEKRMDSSAWITAREKSGALVPYHYTHKGNDADTGKRTDYYLCDYLRTISFRDYRKKHVQASWEEWLDNGCHFSSNQQCREYFESPVQFGDEICTMVISK